MTPSYITGFHPSLKLMVLIVLVISSFLLVFLIGTGIGMIFFGTDIIESLTMDSEGIDKRSLAILKYFQVVNQIGVFIIPALIFAWLNDRRVEGYLKLNPVTNVRFYIIGVVVLFTTLPFINWLIDLNNNIDLPSYMETVETWFRQMEEEAMRLNEAFLNTTKLGGLIVNLFMIALLASVGEELIFRGILVRIFVEWTKNVHLGVVISAILFSALHLQFYGFLPRFVLGLVLGYLFIRSGTLWVPILVHFVNNAMAVVLTYLSNKGIIDLDLESLGSTENVWIIIITVVISFGIMMYSRVLGKKRGEEL